MVQAHVGPRVCRKKIWLSDGSAFLDSCSESALPLKTAAHTGCVICDSLYLHFSILNLMTDRSCAAEHTLATGAAPTSVWSNLTRNAPTERNSASAPARPMTFEEFRSQEPPQARLLRLRGLFDLLLDHDSSAALAGGRAKQMWHNRARRARYGAGGELAAGSLASTPSTDRRQSAHVNEWLSLVRRQSYASELLALCRERREELAHDSLKEIDSHGSYWEHCGRLVDMVQESHNPTWNGWLHRLLSHAQSSPLMNLESGWKGSRVWGLKAVDDGRTNAHDTITTSEPKDEAERARQRQIEWEGFVAYAAVQERDLYRLFNDMDANADGKLDMDEISTALAQAGIHPSVPVLQDFIASLASSGVEDVSDLHDSNLFVTFPEFRDYLLLLPRYPTVAEIFRFYQVRKVTGLFGRNGIFGEFGETFGRTARGPTSVNPDGDVMFGGEIQNERKSTDPKPEPVTSQRKDVIQCDVALKFLLAGGIAGAVSRTATAPFDRLKIFLITSQAARKNAGIQAPNTTRTGLGAIAQSIVTIYKEGGVRGFWLGNGLNCIKIFPESAIKFLSYEASKRFFARYVDHVNDSRDICGFSRFVSGGIGGITSQLVIYPIETLKTRLMSSQTVDGTVRGMALLRETAVKLYHLGGIPAFYRGLAAGLVGVFPYSAIDMSTFDGLKLFYLRYTGKEDPGVVPLLAFGSISGSIGATSVYPLNLVRTRLQASGTPAHPVMYVIP